MPIPIAAARSSSIPPPTGGGPSSTSSFLNSSVHSRHSSPHHQPGHHDMLPAGSSTPFMRASYLENPPHSPYMSATNLHLLGSNNGHGIMMPPPPPAHHRDPSPAYGLREDEVAPDSRSRLGRYGDRTAGTGNGEECTPLLMPSAKVLAATPVYPLIHTIRVDIMSHIDTPLTIDQLLAPDSTYTIVRPLTEKYGDMRNHAIIFCLMVNRLRFIKDSNQLSISTLSQSRAMLCEILAIRVLREWSERTLTLASLLLTPWALFQGASEAVIARAREEGDEDSPAELAGNALEMAILGNSKRFIRSPSAQKVIDGIWSGRIIYQAMNQHAIIADNYKIKPIQMYNPHRAPLLDHYRLKVPKIRSAIEYTNFIILFMLYIFALEGLVQGTINWKETAFIIYAMSFSLDKLAAMREHGLRVFAANLWNGFDLVFIGVYFTYLVFRVYGLQRGHQWATELSTDVLAMGAVGMFPRLAFVTLSDNLMILSLRSMLSEFFILMGIAGFCFIGFAYALWTLGGGKFAWSTIAWYLLEVYFGLDASGFEAADQFNRFLGPVLMISFACLSNTLLLTVLVAILSNTFATISADAAAESMFRKAVSTLEGVKADAVFSYQLPFNIVAVVCMFPMSFILSPRWFHKVNVFFIRATSFPILIIIAVYERQKYSQVSLWDRWECFSENYLGNLPRILGNAAGLESFAGASKDLDVVFEIEEEIGDFYRGWDDDDVGSAEEDDHPFVDDESDADSHEGMVLPLPAETLETVVESPSSTPLESAPPSVQSSEPPRRTGISFTRTPTVPVSGSARAPSYNRRLSMPASDREIAATGLNNLLLSPPRRKMSTTDISPLARLFARSLSPDRSLGFRPRHRANSMSASHTLGGNRNSMAGKASADMDTIEEGKSVTFATPPRASLPEATDNIAKASEVQEAGNDLSPVVAAVDIHARLEAIEVNQKRIEDMLETLVQQGARK